MQVHAAREIAIAILFLRRALGLGDLDQEFRRLAIDHQHAVARQEHHGVRAQPAAGLLVLGGVLQQKVAAVFEAEGLQRVGKADFGELAGAARARQRAPQRVEPLALLLHLARELLHGFREIADMLRQIGARLAHALLRFLLDLGILALVVVQQLRGELLPGLEQRRLGRQQALLLEALEIGQPLLAGEQLLPRRRQVPLRRQPRHHGTRQQKTQPHRQEQENQGERDKHQFHVRLLTNRLMLPGRNANERISGSRVAAAGRQARESAALGGLPPRHRVDGFPAGAYLKRAPQ